MADHRPDHLEGLPWPSDTPWTGGRIAPLEPESRWGPPNVGLPAQVFNLETVEEITLPRELLNDEAIDGCGILLKRLVIENGLRQDRSLLFSCFEIRRVQEGCPAKQLWRLFQPVYEQVRA